MKQLTEDGLIPTSRISPSRSHSPISEMGKSRSPARGRVPTQHSVNQLEDFTCKLNPVVEGRILELTPEVQNQQHGTIFWTPCMGQAQLLFSLF